MFHLAYLGLMFGGQSEEEASLEIQVGIMYCMYIVYSY